MLVEDRHGSGNRTKVLMVGAGPAGLATSALLSMYGVENLVINKYGWLANTPRAHITNQGTMQVLRDLGIEDRAMSLAAGQNLRTNNVFCHSLAGEEYGRVLSWGQPSGAQGRLRTGQPDRVQQGPGVLHGRCRPPPSAAERAGLEHLRAGRL